jgi:hypothetical protein
LNIRALGIPFATDAAAPEAMSAAVLATNHSRRFHRDDDGDGGR